MDTTIATTTSTIESPKTNYYAPITKEMILDYLRELKPQLEKDGITKLGLFGSYARDCADENSDIDIVIRTNDEFRKKYVGFAAFIFLEKLRTGVESHFGLDADLCNLKNYTNDEISKFFKGAIYV